MLDVLHIGHIDLPKVEATVGIGLHPRHAE